MKVGTLIKQMYETLEDWRFNDAHFLNKIMEEVHNGRLPNEHIYEAVYSIIEHFNHNIKMLEGKSKKKQEEILFDLLYNLSFAKDYSKLFDWLMTADGEDYVDTILRTEYQCLTARSLQELLQQAYDDFIQEIGNSLIKALVKFSD
jgi:uncharacterized membrane protein YheB (UPF0754 family)